MHTEGIQTTTIEQALKAAEDTINALHARDFPGLAKNQRIRLSVEYGEKYARIVRSEEWDDQPREYSRSAWGFIKLDDLTIWKAAGWKYPAKNKARGTVEDLKSVVKVGECWRYGVK